MIDFRNTLRALAPSVSLVAGSGVAASLQEFPCTFSIPYSAIDGFPHSSIVGHSGELQVRVIDGTPLLVFSGRFHLYEGKSVEEVIMPIRLSHELGIRNVILTNAAGGLNPVFHVGDIMLNREFIDLTFRRILQSHLRPSNVPGKASLDTEVSPSFMSSDTWLDDTRSKLIELGCGFQEGVYCSVLGPNYETSAEIRMLRKIGADAVGMSTVHEWKEAGAIGMSVVACSIITNSLKEISTSKVTHDEVVSAGIVASDRMRDFIRSAVQSIGS